ncbi:response regulator [Candidatus Acetothermia bacterium]|jgi:DNA-binding response OmpR family regulator|nr:response regulator [Candidatus Acetothermia bacterium]MCI2431945.1 response regulator [Candidatus Acetothermia bacterium]MCI2436626.1 response regulator [Candidatus Acetothermia bacterium]
MNRILLAEDDPQIARLIQFKLQREGFSVTWAENGEEALKALRSSLFDLVILDVMMPVKDGFSVLAELKTDAHLHKLPVMMLTARANERDLLTGFQSGATDYIAKPFDPAHLVERVRALVEP